jgi:hypothetical protein
MFAPGVLSAREAGGTRPARGLRRAAPCFLRRQVLIAAAKLHHARRPTRHRRVVSSNVELNTVELTKREPHGLTLRRPHQNTSVQVQVCTLPESAPQTDSPSRSPAAASVLYLIPRLLPWRIANAAASDYHRTVRHPYCPFHIRSVPSATTLCT